MAITLNGTTGISSPGGDTSTSLATTNLSYTGTLTGGTGVIAIGTNQIYKDASGNVGIGTASPLAKLSIGSGTLVDANVPIQMNAAASSGVAYIGFNNAGGYGLLVGYDNVVGYARIRNISNTSLAFSTNDTERMRINTNGALVFAGGNTAASGVGIAFPATQSASSDANTLDDYEEGTWTPTLGGNTTYIQQGGSYVKIGRLVFCNFIIQVNVIGTGSAKFITGLPYAYSNPIARTGGSLSYLVNAASNAYSWLVNVDGQGVYFDPIQSLTSGIAADAANIFTSGTYIMGSFQYTTST